MSRAGAPTVSGKLPLNKITQKTEFTHLNKKYLMLTPLYPVLIPLLFLAMIIGVIGTIVRPRIFLRIISIPFMLIEGVFLVFIWAFLSCFRLVTQNYLLLPEPIENYWKWIDSRVNNPVRWWF